MKKLLLITLLSLCTNAQADFIDVKMQVDYESNVFRIVPIEQVPEPIPEPEPEPIPEPTPEPPEEIGLNIWADHGISKILQEETPMSDGEKVSNFVWDGEALYLTAFKNELVSFQIILEALSDQENISVSLNELSDGSNTLQSNNSLFQYINDEINLYKTRYLEIKGLSIGVGYPTWDQRHIPEGLRGKTWAERENANKHYPDILVPLELEPVFSIAEGNSQSIYGDIYIPKNQEAGVYSGEIKITQNDSLVKSIPIKLKVHNAILPDGLGKAGAWVDVDSVHRYVSGNCARPFNYKMKGACKINPDVFPNEITQPTLENLARVYRRHRITPMWDDQDYVWAKRYGGAWYGFIKKYLTGELFTSDKYNGPAEGKRPDMYWANVYSVNSLLGAVGKFNWALVSCENIDEDILQSMPDGYKTCAEWEARGIKSFSDGITESIWHEATNWWVNEFKNYPDVDLYTYIRDVENNWQPEWFARIKQISRWNENNSDIGKAINVYSTLGTKNYYKWVKNQDIANLDFQILDTTENYFNKYIPFLKENSREIAMYNGVRPYTGSFVTEDDATALIANSWGMQKVGIDWWWYWDSVGWRDNYNNNRPIDPYKKAQTYGDTAESNSKYGEFSHNYSNGDGVLVYPARQTFNGFVNYDKDGVFPSLRMKLWSRGIQDKLYLEMAEMIDPIKTKEIINKCLPVWNWEIGVEDPEDPSYVFSDTPWVFDGNHYEKCREEVRNLIIKE